MAATTLPVSAETMPIRAQSKAEMDWPSKAQSRKVARPNRASGRMELVGQRRGLGDGLGRRARGDQGQAACGDEGRERLAGRVVDERQGEARDAGAGRGPHHGAAQVVAGVDRQLLGADEPRRRRIQLVPGVVEDVTREREALGADLLDGLRRVLHRVLRVAVESHPEGGIGVVGLGRTRGCVQSAAALVKGPPVVTSYPAQLGDCPRLPSNGPGWPSGATTSSGRRMAAGAARPLPVALGRPAPAAGRAAAAAGSTHRAATASESATNAVAATGARPRAAPSRAGVVPRSGIAPAGAVSEPLTHPPDVVTAPIVAAVATARQPGRVDPATARQRGRVDPATARQRGRVDPATPRQRGASTPRRLTENSQRGLSRA